MLHHEKVTCSHLPEIRAYFTGDQRYTLENLFGALLLCLPASLWFSMLLNWENFSSLFP